MPATPDSHAPTQVTAAQEKGTGRGEKIQPWKKLQTIPKTQSNHVDQGIFEYPESLIRLRCEADDKSLGG